MVLWSNFLRIPDASQRYPGEAKSFSRQLLWFLNGCLGAPWSAWVLPGTGWLAPRAVSRDWERRRSCYVTSGASQTGPESSNSIRPWDFNSYLSIPQDTHTVITYAWLLLTTGCCIGLYVISVLRHWAFATWVDLGYASEYIIIFMPKEVARRPPLDFKPQDNLCMNTTRPHYAAKPQ